MEEYDFDFRAILNALEQDIYKKMATAEYHAPAVNKISVKPVKVDAEDCVQIKIFKTDGIMNWSFEMVWVPKSQAWKYSTLRQGLKKLVNWR